MRPRLVLALALMAAALPGVARAYPGAFDDPVPGNPAEALSQLPIEQHRYDRATRCRRTPQPGMVALQRWLEGHVRGTSWGIVRCEKLGPHNFSLHAEGRALDWHLDVGDPADRRAARQLIELLLAPDRAGNPHALARRMGVQEIIWDCRAWWSGGEGMRPYSACLNRRGTPRRHVDRTIAHRNHVHLGLNRDGARRRTSFWTRRAPAEAQRDQDLDFG